MKIIVLVFVFIFSNILLSESTENIYDDCNNCNKCNSTYIFEKILYDNNLDIDSKSVSGWIRILNNSEKSNKYFKNSNKKCFNKAKEELMLLKDTDNIKRRGDL